MALPSISGEYRLVEDPDLRFAPSGTAVASMRLVTSSRKQENGQWVDDKTFWIRATAFSDLAEHIVESTRKGDLIVLVGRIQTDSWTTQDGQNRQAPSILVDAFGPSLRFRVTPHHDGDNQGGGNQGGQQQRPAQGQQPQGAPQNQRAPQNQSPWEGAAQNYDDEPPF